MAIDGRLGPSTPPRPLTSPPTSAYPEFLLWEDRTPARKSFIASLCGKVLPRYDCTGPGATDA
jgi:hypothetical protein